MSAEQVYREKHVPRGSKLSITGLSGNEIYCLGLKGYQPGEIVVGNSVRSLGLAGGLGAFGKTLSGGEITQITELISEGRHLAISRMEKEAQEHGASGISGVVSELKTLAGYTEFLSQGSAIYHRQAGEGASGSAGPFFSTAASGIELYCHLDAGFHPRRFVMGNVAYALGVGRGLTGSLRTLKQGEVKEFSDMYNGIRHLALQRLQAEAAAAGANAVVDLQLKLLPFGPGTLELLITGTAASHPRLAQGTIAPNQVVTSELTGEELWNLAQQGYAPLQLVMATSVYALGLGAGLGTFFKSFQRGELPEVTQLIYHARENCLDLIRREAEGLGADRVIGNRLIIKELSPGLIEVVAIGTALQRLALQPASETLPVQAVIVDRDVGAQILGTSGGQGEGQSPGGQASPAGCAIAIIAFILMMMALVVGIVAAAKGGGKKRRGDLGPPPAAIVQLAEAGGERVTGASDVTAC